MGYISKITEKGFDKIQLWQEKEEGEKKDFLRSTFHHNSWQPPPAPEDGKANFNLNYKLLTRPQLGFAIHYMPEG